MEQEVEKVLAGDSDFVAVHREQKTILYVHKQSRDAIVAANAFLSVLHNTVDDIETKLRIDQITNHLNDMLYGFEKPDAQD